jgi:hypothetical protein
MTQMQNTTQAQAALLRRDRSIDTHLINNLCCEAAGIIAPSNSTTEALLPHEKLREAATPNATLFAQSRPPAQLFEGYTHLVLTECSPNALNKEGVEFI